MLIGRFVHDPPYIKNAKWSPFDNIGFGLLMVGQAHCRSFWTRARRDDWFGAVWVSLGGRGAGLLLIGWLWHSWTHPEGLVDLATSEKYRLPRRGCFMNRHARYGYLDHIFFASMPLYYRRGGPGLYGVHCRAGGGPAGIGSFIGSPV